MMKYLIGILSAILLLQAASAVAEGRVYLMTNSASQNVTSLHIINSASTSQAFTGSLYNGDGERLGAADTSLHNGVLASQGRLVLTATDLESLFATDAWKGPAMLVVNGSAEFELMTKLKSPSGLVSNTNCVREGIVHNVEGFDSENMTFVRFINTGSGSISNLRGTMINESGVAIGTANSILLSSLAPNEQVWLNRNQLAEKFGEQWDGIASLEITSTVPDLKLLNLNFVNNETFFNFSCFESSGSAEVYLMTNSKSANVSETHIINTSDQAQTFSATVHNGDGSQNGGAASALHTGSIAPGARFVFDAPALEAATGASQWPGPARVSIEGAGSFDLMTRLRSPSGLISNTNCVRQSNVQNIEGFDSDNMTFVRFINRGSASIRNITGTLYDLNGAVLGTADTLLIDELAANGAQWLNRDNLSALFNVSWVGEASLVVSADDDSDLRLLNLNFVNSETFFNFSCYERSEDGVSAREFYEASVEPTIQSKCIICHINGGVATATPLIYAPSSVADGVDLNFQLLEAYVDTGPTAAQTLLDKARGVNHGGGPQISSDSQAFQDLATFVDLLGAETDASGTLGSYWAGISLLPPAETLRRASVILTGQPPSAKLRADVETGGEAALPAALKALMTGEDFRKFVATGANDRLLTDGFIDGGLALDTADLNFPFFAKGAQKKYEFNVEIGGFGADVDRQWVGDWYWGLGRAPVELIAYVVANDRDYREVVTGDYYMVNYQTNDILNAGASFDADEAPNVFKRGENRGQIVTDEAFSGEFVNDLGFRVDSRGDFIDYPHAGVLNTHAYLSRYPSTETNRNRARARWTYYHFLGVDIEKSASRTTDPVALADTNNPTMNNPACIVCHSILDPMAGTFQNYGNSGFYRDSDTALDALPATYKYPRYFDPDAEPSAYVPGDTWYRDMRTPAFNGETAPDNTNSVQWLGQQIAADPRFASASVKFWWPALMGAPPVAAPEVTTDVDFSQRLAAFEEQTAFINEVGEAFAAGIDGGSPFNARDLLVKMLMSPWFRADRAATETVRDQMVSGFGTRRLLTPEELERKSESLFGWKWGHWDAAVASWEFDRVWSNLGNQYRTYYGGIDSVGVTERATALTPLMANVAEKHALEMSCPAVAVEFEKTSAQRTLFSGISLDATPDTDEAGIREKIVDLHYQFWGESHSPDDPEVDDSYELLEDIYRERQALGWTWQYQWPEESCYFFLSEHWEDGGLGHRGEDPTYMRGAWSGLLVYLMLDYKFLHE